MTKVITYGIYDLLHQGHINLLRHAKKLGDHLIVGVTSDRFSKALLAVILINAYSITSIFVQVEKDLQRFYKHY